MFGFDMQTHSQTQQTHQYTVSAKFELYSSRAGSCPKRCTTVSMFDKTAGKPTDTVDITVSVVEKLCLRPKTKAPGQEVFGEKCQLKQCSI